jgi:hypothetical protein
VRTAIGRQYIAYISQQNITRGSFRIMEQKYISRENPREVVHDLMPIGVSSITSSPHWGNIHYQCGWENAPQNNGRHSASTATDGNRGCCKGSCKYQKSPNPEVLLDQY